MLNIEAEINQRFPQFFQRKRTRYIAKPLLAFLRSLFHEREIRQFGERYEHLTGIDFIEQVFDYFSFSYSVRANEIERIPTKGKAVLIANHPIGTLDGMALIKMVSQIRPDVKVVANDMLMIIKPLHSHLLPVDNMNGGTASKRLKAIESHLEQEGLIIIFPAGEVSRFSPKGVQDGKWRNGFLRISQKQQAPIIPVLVNAKNSFFFYSLSILSKPMSTLWLIREMFKHGNNAVDIRIGEQISYGAYHSMQLPINTKTALFRKHVYRLSSNKPNIFSTQSAIAHPENALQLRNEIQQCECLFTSRDGKKVYLYEHKNTGCIMREIGRLREESFRFVGEGTGERRDVDCFDKSYVHILLWDDTDFELIGAYRLLPTENILNKVDLGQLYSATLFEYTKEIIPFLPQGLELGRSFIQPKYWGSRSLEYLWQGIMVYITEHTACRYLFGTVSMSNSYSKAAQEMLIYYYQAFYGNTNPIAKAKLPFVIPGQRYQELEALFEGHDAQSGFNLLKAQLNHMGFSVPTLFKQYTKLCSDDGVSVYNFNIDPNFNNCVDALLILDLNKLTEKNKRRFGTEKRYS